MFVPCVIVQAFPLRVDELKMLHTELLTGETWDMIFTRAILFAVYSRGSWSDPMHFRQVLRDWDDNMQCPEVHGGSQSIEQNNEIRNV